MVIFSYTESKHCLTRQKFFDMNQCPSLKSNLICGFTVHHEIYRNISTVPIISCHRAHANKWFELPFPRVLINTREKRPGHVMQNIVIEIICHYSRDVCCFDCVWWQFSVDHCMFWSWNFTKNINDPRIWKLHTLQVPFAVSCQYFVHCFALRQRVLLAAHAYFVCSISLVCFESLSCCDCVVVLVL